MAKDKDKDKEIHWLLEEKYGGVPTAEFCQNVERLKNGEPVDYVIGFTEFLGCRIDLSTKPFIPRHETEFWTEKAIQDIRSNPKRQINVLDIFSGSGCIGIAVLRHDRRVSCCFADCEEPACPAGRRFLVQIKRNAKINRIDPRRFRVVKSDVFSAINEQYDYILANPPYVAAGQPRNVDPRVLKYEPPSAVLAGDGGLAVIKKFLKEAPQHLNPGGKIYLEFAPMQKGALKSILREFGFQDFAFAKDQFGRWRYLVAEVML